MKEIKNKLLLYWPQFVLFLLSFFVIWPLLRSGYFSHQDDLQVIRIVEMRKCFADFQIPCRWVPDMGWGNGYPLFNYYGVFTYYLGGIISYVFNYLVTAKTLFGIALVFGSFGIYYFVSKLFDNKFAGFVSSVLYLFAPYKALDVYVRGALGETMALAIIPFVFYFLLSLFDKKDENNKRQKKYFILFVLSLFAFLTTHNIMNLVFLPVLIVFSLYLLIVNKFLNLKIIIAGFGLSFLLSSFFLLPAFLEKDLVQTESLTRFELDYRANFVSINSLFFDRSWGYGTSIPGPEGKMNFQIGTIHWLLSFVTFVYLVILSLKKKKIDLLGLSIFVVFVLSAFMMHNKSGVVWEQFKILEYFQFPWRFLSLSIFTSSILGGMLVSKLNSKYQLTLVFVISLLTVLLNFSYFKPREFYNITNLEKTTGESWELQRKGALLDYLPKTALEPREGAQSLPSIVSGKAEVRDIRINSNSFEFNVNVLEKSEIEIPVFYFPNWEVMVNDKKIDIRHDNILGRIEFDLEKGEHVVSGKFRNTLVRNIGNTLTLVGLFSLIVFVSYNFRKTK